MAVQKSKKSRSRRGMRRAHDGLKTTSLAIDSLSGETHRRHHMSADGYYKGRQIIAPAETADDVSEDEA